MDSEVAVHPDFINPMLMVLLAIGLAIVRQTWDAVDSEKIGEIKANIPVPWSFFSYSSELTKACFALSMVLSLAGGTFGIVRILHASNGLIFASASFPFVFSLYYCRKPYFLTIGSRGLYWKGRYYSWDCIDGIVDRDRKEVRLFVRMQAKESPISQLTISLAHVPATDLQKLVDAIAFLCPKQRANRL